MTSTVHPIGTAVVGCGSWGRNLVRNFAELGALRAVVDPSPTTTAPFVKQFGVPAISLEQALADPRIDSIAIASPAALHHEIALRSILAGKHVLVEKPMALSLGQGEDLRRQAEATGVVLMVGHLLQYHSAYRRLREMVAEGAIGKLRYVYSNRLSMGKLRVDEDVVWSFAPHDISMILGLAGGEEPSSVVAHTAQIASQDNADTAHLHLGFPSGLKAHVFVSWIHPFKEHRFVAVGERACLVFDDSRSEGQKLIRTDYDIVHGPALARGEVVSIAIDVGEPLKAECRHFLQAVAGGTRPITDATESLAVLRVLTAADASLGLERRQ